MRHEREKSTWVQDFWFEPLEGRIYDKRWKAAGGTGLWVSGAQFSFILRLPTTSQTESPLPKCLLNLTGSLYHPHATPGNSQPPSQLTWTLETASCLLSWSPDPFSNASCFLWGYTVCSQSDFFHGTIHLPYLMPFSGFLWHQTPFPGSQVPVPSDAHFHLHSPPLLNPPWCRQWASRNFSNFHVLWHLQAPAHLDLSAWNALSPPLHGHGWFFPILQVSASQRAPPNPP